MGNKEANMCLCRHFLKTTSNGHFFTSISIHFAQVTEQFINSILIGKIECVNLWQSLDLRGHHLAVTTYGNCSCIKGHLDDIQVLKLAINNNTNIKDKIVHAYRTEYLVGQHTLLLTDSSNHLIHFFGHFLQKPVSVLNTSRANWLALQYKTNTRIHDICPRHHRLLQCQRHIANVEDDVQRNR